MQVMIGQWGNNLAARLPAALADVVDFRKGERVSMETKNDVIVIRRIEAPITLAGLFRGKTPDAWRCDYQDAYDWGPDMGREASPD